jgi:predicted PurR-regulated permease PerM
VGTAAEELLAVLGTLVAGFAALTTLLFVALFMNLYGPGLVRAALREVLPERQARYRAILDKVYDSVGGYLTGLTAIAALNTTFTTIALAVLGVPFFLPLGILSGLGSLIPLVGATIAGILLVAVAAASQGLWIGVAMAAYVVVYQQIENHVFGPVVYRRTAGMNPLVTLLAVVYVAELHGMMGALLAVPAVAVGQILLREVLALRRERLGLPVDAKEAP